MLVILSMNVIQAKSETFFFSGGCFWCTEADFEGIDGVKEVISGFTAGTTPNPKYYPGKWGDHREAAKVLYDPNLISFEDLVKNVFNTIDYEDSDGQFCDRGRSYSPAIYFKNDVQKNKIIKLAPLTSKVAIEKVSSFYPVRAEHQNYYKKNSMSYTFYRIKCQRDKRLKELKKIE